MIPNVILDDVSVTSQLLLPRLFYLHSYKQIISCEVFYLKIYQMRLGNISELNDAFRFPVDLFNLRFLHFFLYEKKYSSTTVLRLFSHRPEI